jgi:hypothetical protein
MRETSETIAGGKVFGGGNRSCSAQPIAVGIDFCAASSHIGGRPFGHARRFLVPAKQKSRVLVPETANRMHGTKPRVRELG